MCVDLDNEIQTVCVCVSMCVYLSMCVRVHVCVCVCVYVYTCVRVRARRQGIPNWKTATEIIECREWSLLRCRPIVRAGQDDTNEMN